ncbi:MAG: dipeptidase [Polyangiaceae bacterium]|nr:dipeptidase [Polyangiaceae bacterium]
MPQAGAGRDSLVSREAMEIYLASDVIDLHIDSFTWTRIFGYDITARHGHGLLGARFYSQVDLPRIREAHITGGIWVITTNPLRPDVNRAQVFAENLARLRAIFDGCPKDVAFVRTASDYREARAKGLHAAFIGIQGGNAVDANVDLLTSDIVRVTLVHLSNSRLGTTSAPGGGNDGLTRAGKDFVRVLNDKKIFVDLAHINRRGFFDAMAVHDRDKPVVVTHTGVSGAHRHWRNLDDDQLRAIADTGGTIGVVFHSPFLGGSLWGCQADRIVMHLDHIVKTVGEDFASLGSDWDGAIVTPRDMPTCLELPRLVQCMLDRGWNAARIHKVLGKNWLRVLAQLRP